MSTSGPSETLFIRPAISVSPPPPRKARLHCHSGGTLHVSQVVRRLAEVSPKTSLGGTSDGGWDEEHAGKRKSMQVGSYKVASLDYIMC